jgi:phenylalanyl-tRNA synthetase alpha chain
LTRAGTACIRFSSTAPPSTSHQYNLFSRTYDKDDHSNVSPTIISKFSSSLLSNPSHPLCIVKSIIESHFSSFTPIPAPPPIVTVEQNFDVLGFAPDHPGRAITDSYYINRRHMLRAHTSAHEVEVFGQGHDAWLLSADVYRRDEIDSSHYPVFHQMEGARVWSKDELKDLSRLNAELARQLAECPIEIQDETVVGESNPYQATHDPEEAAQIAQHLKHSINSMIYRLFGQGRATESEPLKVRWIEAFFPFTTPSYEVEVWYNGEWLEILGSGVVQQKTLNEAGTSLFPSC